MYVIVVGAGEVGSYVADRLSREGHDVAVVEEDPDRLRAVANELDVLTTEGSGSHRKVLLRAGAADAELLVAVTNSDETNLIASLVAKQLGVARTIARVQASELRDEHEDLKALFDADEIIDPDEEAAQDIVELLEFPGASEVEAFGGGQALVIGATLQDSSPLVGRTLHEVAREYEPNWEFLFGTISSRGETVIPRGDQQLHAGDQVRVLCQRSARRQLMGLLGLARRLPRRVMLLGGGRTAELVAAELHKRGTRVVIVERDAPRTRQLAERLPGVEVIRGDFTHTDVLIDAGIADFDIVAALAGEDDANILGCLFAKARGATETIAIVHRLELLPLLRQAGIDASLSPRTATANGVLRYVREGVAGVATFLEGPVELLEFEIQPGSRTDGAVVKELGLPHEVLIGAILSDGDARIARGHSRLVAGDHVVVFAMSSAVGEASRYFS